MAGKTTETLTVRFAWHKSTPGTERYAELVPEAVGEPHIGTLYLRKAAAAKLGNPTELTVTIAAQ